MSAKCGVVICNYNKENEVIDCILSVLESKTDDYHIYVVDNGSSDNSVREIKHHFGAEEKLTLIENSENLGGSGGFNTGLKMAFDAGHEYLMCVDNDAILDENCISELMSFLNSHDDVGMAAAKIYHLDMPGYIQQYGSFIDYDNYNVDSIYLNHPEDGTLPEFVYSDAVPACALMVKRSVASAIGFLPEEFFLYWDDTEWCQRCIAAGYRVASVGSAGAAHAMGAKKESVNTFPTYYAWRNWIRFFLCHIAVERLEDMAEVFLGSIFEIAYEGLYRGEKNKTVTVMAALDDALHNVTGRAGGDRIFALEGTYDGIKHIAERSRNVVILSNGFPLYSDALRERLLQYNSSLTVSVVSKLPDNVSGMTIFSVCESIFRQDDLSLRHYIIDLDDNVLENEDQAMRIINFPFAKESFIFAYKPMFVRLAGELRKNLIKS